MKLRSVTNTESRLRYSFNLYCCIFRLFANLSMYLVFTWLFSYNKKNKECIWPYFFKDCNAIIWIRYYYIYLHSLSSYLLLREYKHRFLIRESYQQLANMTELVLARGLACIWYTNYPMGTYYQDKQYFMFKLRKISTWHPNFIQICSAVHIYMFVDQSHLKGLADQQALTYRPTHLIRHKVLSIWKERLKHV